MTEAEMARVREGMRVNRHTFSLYHWRSYFCYLLGRHVSLDETRAMLASESAEQEAACPSVG